MADPKIKLKRSSVEGKIPTPDQVPLGEIALNTYDGYLYASKNVGIGTTVIAINPFRVGTGTNTYNAYFTAGNVGIGSETPNRKLVIEDSGNTFLSVRAGTSDDVGLIFGDTDSDARGLIRYANNGDSLRFWTAGSEKVRIDSDGKFGIGTNNPTSKLHVVGDTLVTGVSTFQSHVHLGDDDELRFGASNDFKIVHDPNDCRFENSNGDIKFKNTGSYFFFDEDGGETLASFINDGAINLYYAGSKKFETTTSGVTVTGTVSATSFSGDGSQLTGISAGLFAETDVGIHTLSNVGIGTTNPIAKLEVNVGSAVTALDIQGSEGQLFSVTNQLSSGSIFSVNDISGIPSIDVDADGTIQLAPYGTGEKVGIGTTEPKEKLHVVGVVSATSFFGDGSNLSNITSSGGVGVNSGGTNIGYGITTLNFIGSGTTIEVSGTTATISAGSGGGGGLFSETDVGIHTLSNVGIGTTNPIAKLEVNVGSAVTALDIQGSEGQLFSVTNQLSSGSIFSVNDISGIPSIDVDADGTIQLAPYGTGEEVGIGTTLPTAKLDVIGNAKISGILTATSFVGDITGDVTGNADTATSLATARTIGGVSFNGTADINLPGVNAAGNQNTSGTAAGLSGSPNIDVTNITASGNVTIGGTLTYEDVTNVDSVGLITARTGINVVGGGMTVTGIGTFRDSVNLLSGASVTGVVTATSFVKSSNSGGFLKADGTEDTSTYISSIGISSAGTSIGNATALNFVGTKNTFAVNGNTIDISIDGLLNFTEDKNTSSPNNTVPVNSLSVTGTDSHIDLALVPKGAGSIMASIPDASHTGGSKRGTYAIDLQLRRLSGGSVASGDYSALIGGYHNTASGNYSFIGGSYASTVSGTYSAAFGKNVTVSGEQSFAFGTHSLADSNYSFVLGGTYASTRTIQGLVVIPASANPHSTDQNSRALCQKSILNIYAQTTNATPTVLRSNTSSASTTNQLTLKNNSAITFKATCVAGVTGAGNTKVWELRGALKRGANAASTALVGSVIKDVIAYDSGAAAWDLDITADTTNGAIKVEVTGQASTTIRWVCTVEATEMSF